MAFVKLDCGILDSTLWVDRDIREVFITALLMAEPVELTTECEQFEVDSFELTGWLVPPGWYGIVPAAAIGILRRAGISEAEGMNALRKLGNPEPASRSPDFEGRRLARITGGFVVLNFQKYRDRDYTAAERSRRYRTRLAQRDAVSSRCDITQAEAEVERNNTKTGDVENVFSHWQSTFGKQRAVLDPKRRRLIAAAIKSYSEEDIKNCITGYSKSDFHMGKNDRNKPFVDLELLLRDAKHIEEGLGFFAQTQNKDERPAHFRDAI